MNAPFFKFGLFGDEVSLIVAFIIGIGFGFFLERAGFSDLSVFKVMFTAIITAMVGLFWLSWIGFVDLSLVYLNPTFILPQTIGGLILGVGFVIGGYCPGTSCVAAATGKLDAFVFLGGIFAGVFLFAEAYPLLSGFYNSTPMGQITLAQYFNLPYGLVVFFVVLMAIGGFAGSSWVERKFAPAAKEE